MWEKEYLSIRSFPFFSSILLTSAGKLVFFLFCGVALRYFFFLFERAEIFLALLLSRILQSGAYQKNRDWH